MKWYVMKSKFKKEFYAKEFFKSMSIDSYVPYFNYNNGKSNKKKIAIPGYVFVSLKKFEYKLINVNPFVGDVLKDHRGVIEISDEEISVMKKHLTSSYDQSDFDGFKIGDNIEITHGHFNGYKGQLVEKRNNKVIINLNSLSIQLVIGID